MSATDVTNTIFVSPALIKVPRTHIESCKNSSKHFEQRYKTTGQFVTEIAISDASYSKKSASTLSALSAEVSASHFQGNDLLHIACMV